jgi:hypothetical protein
LQRTEEGRQQEHVCPANEIRRDSDRLRLQRQMHPGSSPGVVNRLALGLTAPPIQWVTGTLPPGVKRSGREADH